MAERLAIALALAGISLLSACHQGESAEEVLAQCKLTMAQITHTTNLDDVSWSDLKTCMESKGFAVDLSLVDCGKLNGPSALAKCYRPIPN